MKFACLGAIVASTSILAFLSSAYAFFTSDADAARRELHEELGVEVTEVGDEEFVSADPDSAFLIVFTPVRIIGEPACREHIAFQWGRPSELARLPLAPSDRRYVEYRCADSSP